MCALSRSSNMGSLSGGQGGKRELSHVNSFDLTGKTGSFFYMAPEVADSLPYNEKACALPMLAFEGSGMAVGARVMRCLLSSFQTGLRIVRSDDDKGCADAACCLANCACMPGLLLPGVGLSGMGWHAGGRVLLRLHHV